MLWYSPAMDDVQQKRPRGRPRTGVTPKRNIRIGPIWDEAAAIAAARGETMTAVVERGLERYVARHRGELTQTAEGDHAATGPDSSG